MMIIIEVWEVSKAREEQKYTWVSGSWQAQAAFPAESRRCWVAVETPLSCHCRLEEKATHSCVLMGLCFVHVSMHILPHSPTGTTSWYWLRLEPLKVLEGRGMTGGLVCRESSTTCDKRKYYSSGRILVLRPIHWLVICLCQCTGEIQCVLTLHLV